MEGAMSYPRPVSHALPFTDAGKTRIRRALESLAGAWHLWRQRGAERRRLAALDIRSLRELGIAPELANYELRQPFWRPMRDRRH
jgi:uncharacterized protein YjiS (DUF1127 family)